MSDEVPAVRDAASVILVRERPGAGVPEIFLVRRHGRASFMSSAFVFPGGVVDSADASPREAAARELFEEAGVLLAGSAPAPGDLASLRRRVHAGEPLRDLLAARGLALDPDRLRYFAHWITPSMERKRFSAVFFVAELPPGQTASFDDRETVDEIWVTPTEGLARARELALPPPQVRTFHDLAGPAREGLDGIRAACDRRAESPHPILPRPAPHGSRVALLLPWDPEYASAGNGDALAMPEGHPLAEGPSRFVLEDRTWKNVHAPSFPSAD